MTQKSVSPFWLSRIILVFVLFLRDVATLATEGQAVHSPSFSPDCSKLVYLDNPVGGPHKQCSRLVMVMLSGFFVVIFIWIDSILENCLECNLLLSTTNILK